MVLSALLTITIIKRTKKRGVDFFKYKEEIYNEYKGNTKNFFFF
jgi:hypothetical protein